MEGLANDGLVAPETVTHFADGALVMVASIDPPPDPTSLAEDPDVSHVAVANPELAPYGAAAKRHLEATGQWSGLASKVVFSESVRQALQFVRSGNAEAGFVPLSLVSPTPPPGVTVVERVPVSAGALPQTIGRVAETERAQLADMFIAFLSSDPHAREALLRFGYAAPESGGAQ